MNPIKIKLSPDQIIALENMMQVQIFKKETMQDKAFNSILLVVSDKIHLKYRNAKNRIDLFNVKKATSLELKYHEAYALCAMTTLYLEKLDRESKRRNDILKINLDLHKKMQ